MTINLDKIFGVTVSTLLTITLWGGISKSNPTLLAGKDPRLVALIVGLTNGVMYVGINAIADKLLEE